MMDVTLQYLQERVAALVTAIPDLRAIPVLTELADDLESEIERAVASVGQAIVVVTAEGERLGTGKEPVPYFRETIRVSVVSSMVRKRGSLPAVRFLDLLIRGLHDQALFPEAYTAPCSPSRFRVVRHFLDREDDIVLHNLDLDIHLLIQDSTP